MPLPTTIGHLAASILILQRQQEAFLVMRLDALFIIGNLCTNERQAAVREDHRTASVMIPLWPPRCLATKTDLL